MDYDLRECKMTALASFSFKSRVPKRFLAFMQTPECDQILVRSIEFARVFLRYTHHQQSNLGVSRTIEREQDAVSRLLCEEYVALVRANSWSGPSSQRCNHADAQFFETLFQMIDATLVRVLKSTPAAHIQLIHNEINRVLRSPSFNAARHFSESGARMGYRSPWRELPSKRSVLSKRVKNKKLPENERSLGIVKAVRQKSPLVAVKCPSISDKVKGFNKMTISLRRDEGVGIPGLPHRCVPTGQLCILGKCPKCSIERFAATQKFFETRRLEQDMNWFASAEPKATVAPELLKKLRGLSFDAYRMKHEKTIDMAVAMMQDLGLLQQNNISNDTFISFLIDVAALHGRTCFTNWSHSVNVCQRLYYLLTTGGASSLFSQTEVFGMLISALCSGSKFPGNDPVVVSSSSELWMLQRDGSPFTSHYLELPRVIYMTGQAPHCNVFGKLDPAARSTVEQCIHVCTQGLHVLPMTKRFITLPLPPKVHVLPKQAAFEEPQAPLLCPVGAFSERLQSQGASGRMSNRAVLKELPPTELQDCLPLPQSRQKQRAASCASSRIGGVQFRESDQPPDFDMMQLMMFASWLFYGAMPSAVHTSHKYHMEMFAEGDKQAAALPEGAIRANSIAPCCDRKALDPDGAEQRVHATFVELVILPLYKTLKARLGATGRIDPLIAAIMAFHMELRHIAKVDMLDDKSPEAVKFVPYPLSRSLTMPLPQMCRGPSHTRQHRVEPLPKSRLMPSMHYQGAKVMLPRRFTTSASMQVREVALDDAHHDQASPDLRRCTSFDQNFTC